MEICIPTATIISYSEKKTWQRTYLFSQCWVLYIFSDYLPISFELFLFNIRMVSIVVLLWIQQTFYCLLFIYEINLLNSRWKLRSFITLDISKAFDEVWLSSFAQTPVLWSATQALELSISLADAFQQLSMAITHIFL